MIRTQLKHIRASYLLVVVLSCFAAGMGCRAAETPPVSEAVELDMPTRFPEPQRLVAIGDVHGDLAATRAALRLAGAIDEDDRWIGGDLVVVQLGDVFDRGGDELEILDLFEDLAAQARAAGGDLHALNGNHELMNVRLDMRYVTLEGFLDFLPAPVAAEGKTVLPEMVVDGVRARILAMRPGGPIALRLAERNVVAIVGDTVLVHGGVLPHVIDYDLERLNQESRQWLRGEIACPPDGLLARDGPVWSRHYSEQPDEADCLLLEEVLGRLGAERMVVGHTVQEGGISPACGERVWRVDVGMAAHYGGTPSVLDLSNGGATILTEVQHANSN